MGFSFLLYVTNLCRCGCFKAGHALLIKQSYIKSIYLQAAFVFIKEELTALLRRDQTSPFLNALTTADSFKIGAG